MKNLILIDNFYQNPYLFKDHALNKTASLVAYVGVGLLLNTLGFGLFTLVVLLVGVCMQISIIWPVLMRKFFEKEVLS